MSRKKTAGAGDMDKLRVKAERLQKQVENTDFSNLSVAEVQKLVQELQLYQIELEMQNEQLQAVTEELTQTTEKLTDLFDFAPVGYLKLDKSALILEANLTFARQVQVVRGNLLKTRFTKFICPQDQETFVQFLRRILTSENRQTCELTFTLPGDTVFTARLEGIASPVNGSSSPSCRLAVIDITEQKLAEKQLHESRNFVSKVADTMPDILTVYDLINRRNIYCNREIEQVLGISPERLKVMLPEELLGLIHPEDLEEFIQNMARVRFLQDGEVFEFQYRVRNAEGEWRYMLVRTVIFQRLPDGEASQILSIQQDVTLRNEISRELRLKNQIVAGLQSNLPVIVSLISQEGIIRTITGSGLDVLKNAGVTNLVGKSIFEVYPAGRGNFEAVLQKGEKVSFTSCFGEEQKTCFKNYFFFDPSQQAGIMFSIDISEQMASEERIRAEREFSQNLLNTSVDGILAFDTELRFTAWNKVMEQNTGLPKEILLGRKIFEMFPHLEATDAGKALPRVLAGKRVVLHDQNFTLRDKFFEAYLNPLINENQEITGGICILHNVTARKKAEAETLNLKLEQQKTVMNAVLNTQEEERKRIAESLHNGVGQLLYAAKLNLEQNTLEKPAKTKVLNELLEEAIKEVRTMSFELMPRILEDFGLETALEELHKRLDQTNLCLSIKTKDLGRFSPNIEIAIYRIIQELVNNILKHAAATEATVHVVSKRNSLKIIAEDNGVGFNAEEALAAPKGLGLTSIRNRVKLLDGDMKIDSRAGLGTIISINMKA